MTPRERVAARVLLIDARGRVLLLHGSDPARAEMLWWFTPGGGLDPGETAAEGAARELREETGLVVEPAALGPSFHHEITEFSYDNRAYRQSQDFFVLRVESWAVDTAGFDEGERETITDHRWWSPEEIDASDELIYPHDLSDLVRRALASSGVA